MAAILRVLAAIAAGAIAGCAGTVPQAREGAVSVAKVERAGWDQPPQPGLFRVRFDAVLAREIRRQAAQMASAQAMDYWHAEILVLEEQADHELRARGLCSGAVKLASGVEGSDGQSGMEGLFRCGVSLIP